MKSKFYIVDNDTWHPSSFYDENTELIWVFTYKLFKKVYISGYLERNKYGIHKDVYNAFLLKFKQNTTKRTRKRKR